MAETVLDSKVIKTNEICDYPQKMSQPSEKKHTYVNETCTAMTEVLRR